MFHLLPKFACRGQFFFQIFFLYFISENVQNTLKHVENISTRQGFLEVGLKKILSPPGVVGVSRG